MQDALLLETALRAAYQQAQAKRRSIRLPTSCRFSGSGKKVVLTLSSRAVTRNMQDDEAAFEAWLLALKAWGCIDEAELAWEPPADRNDGHYQRFLYRVVKFAGLFDWFRVDEQNRSLLDDSRVRNPGSHRFLVNTAQNPQNEPSKNSPESLLEQHLVESGWLARTFGLRLDRVGRQFPVGLFEGKVSGNGGSRVFTGGKSAIDLLGVDDQRNRLWIFELKAGGNQPMGIVSELLFYVHFMLDLLCGRFEFDNEEAPRIKGRLHHQDLKSSGITELIGCFLAPGFHPLLEHDRVVALLNSGQWQGDGDAMKVQFRLHELPADVANLSATRSPVA